MPKVKQKVFRGLRTFDGATTFCTIQSYLDTLCKQGTDLLQALAPSFQSARDGIAISPVNSCSFSTCRRSADVYFNDGMTHFL